jgi:hypothetical protein
VVYGLWRTRVREYVGYLIAVILLHWVTIAVVHPAAISVPIVFARYSAAVLPAMLTLLAIALGAVQEQMGGKSRIVGTVIGATVIGGLVYCGPLRRIYVWPNNFTNHASFQADYAGDRYFNRFHPISVPRFYDELARRPPGTLLVVEAPWYYYWHTYAYYQRIHRQRVAIGFTTRSTTPPVRPGELPVDTSVTLRNAIHLVDRAALARRGADYVILHKNVAYEAALPFSDVPLDITEWITEFALLYGPPCYEDTLITVFDVRRPEVPAVGIESSNK